MSDIEYPEWRDAGLMMSPKDGGPSYAPERDLAYVFPNVMSQVQRMLQSGQPEISKWLRTTGHTDKDIARALGVIRDTLRLIGARPAESPLDYLQEAGWETLDWQLRTAIMSYIGYVLFGNSLWAMGEVMEYGAPKHFELHRAMSDAEELVSYFNGSRLRKWIWKFRWWARGKQRKFLAQGHEIHG